MTTTTIFATETPWSDASYTLAAVSTKSLWKPQYTGYVGPPPPHRNHNLSAAVMGAVGAVSTLAILCLIAGCCLFACRKAGKSRNARRQLPPQQQMVNTSARSTVPTDTRAYAPSSTISPPPTLTSPSTVSAHSTQNEEAPILLSTNIDQSYYTGIDTSDAISLVDDPRQPSHDIGYAASISEPPPPYRPTSIPSFSRESSCRVSGAPPSYRPRLSIINLGNDVRSPFDDPEDDSPVSEVGETSNNGPPIVRDMEEMSDVSEISYQQEPVQARSSL